MTDQTRLLDYGDSLEFGPQIIGQDPLFPDRLTLNCFRHNERGERLITESCEYVRADVRGDQPARHPYRRDHE